MLALLNASGKACVIHPTGTGKSFIGFKLCEDHPDARICWLSPSEYIFKMQLENLRAATDGYEPENIQFFTYAKLMLMREDDLNAIRPDYIILDEFHRAGAERWGQGVRLLLNLYPNVPILGLTATNIRYLDNRRDMAGELFDGSIASEMTLGEAIVRGILNPPKYVLSLFKYQNDLEKYQSRIQQARSKAVRDRSEELLDALRRALDMAEGMDEIFRKHMAEKHGKYLVFCANAEHMGEMIDKAPAWFALVDRHPHIYTAYSEDPETSKAFADFKADASDHLKLLYCIDMLNEGIHVDDVSGVILLRPTVSPIIYKQQIGRALSASKKKNSVIFDIVLNIENLYSISTIQEEMQVAMTYYRSLGMDAEIVNDSFQVIDEVRDCMELFDRLNDTLTASWDLMYVEAKKYQAENGNLNVPRRYVTAAGYSLGQWLDTQRRVRSGKVTGTLTENQIALLNKLGMRWESVADESWNRYYKAAKIYFESHGDLQVKYQYVTKDGLRLGQWLTNLRISRKGDIRAGYLTDERIHALDGIGMQWNVLDYLFEKNFSAAAEYYHTHGNLNVPVSYVNEDGIRLGVWLANLRAAYKKDTLGLTQAQVDRLNELGMHWEGKYQYKWEQSFEEARQYWKVHGNLDVPTGYVTDTGFLLGRWVARQRDFQRNQRLSAARKQKLDRLGMIWEKKTRSKGQQSPERYRAILCTISPAEEGI